tara:strand:+ start:337 stop:474 length:138 start_codon:yes stop_codon:yes gene_type:complete
MNEEENEIIGDFIVVDFEDREDGSTWVRLDLFEHLQALFDKLCGK